MRRLNSICLFLTMFFAASFVSCSKSNDDASVTPEALSLEVTPSVLSFDNDGEALKGTSFNVTTNGSWTAVLVNCEDWVTLGKADGQGNGTVDV
ncbi:MAG: hypothetical protein ACRCZZ_01675, partial [Phocaeicola sp.]